MIEITEKVKKEICEKLSIKVEDLIFLGGGREDSDGTVYTYTDAGQKRVLKIIAIPETEKNNLHKLEVRVKYANYLGENGIQLAYPLHNKNGNLYEQSFDNKHYYTAYVMDYCNGRNPESTELADQLLYNWGKLTGKSHFITKAFKEEVDESAFGYEKEITFFRNWCKDEEVKNAWTDMLQYASKLLRGVNDYGFIHNDNHQRNILVNGESDITLIDFDCSCRQFFIQDITTPVQGIMFDITGGMFNPIGDMDKIKHFFSCFINGYETENHLDDMWYREISTFVNYRRMLLFTCMEDWINTRPDLKQGFKHNILNPPEIRI